MIRGHDSEVAAAHAPSLDDGPPKVVTGRGDISRTKCAVPPLWRRLTLTNVTEGDMQIWVFCPPTRPDGRAVAPMGASRRRTCLRAEWHD